MEGNNEEQYLLQQQQQPRQRTKSKFQYWIFIIPFLGIPGLSGLTLSLQTLLYPIVAETKGAKATQYGPVVGAIYLSLFVFGEY